MTCALDVALGDGDAGQRRRGERGRDPGDDLDVEPGGTPGVDLLHPPPEQERVAALQAHDAGAGAVVGDDEALDVALAGAAALALADVDQRGVGPRQAEDGRAGEPVVEHDVGGAEQRRGPAGEQIGVAGTGADERHPRSVRRIDAVRLHVVDGTDRSWTGGDGRVSARSRFPHRRVEPAVNELVRRGKPCSTTSIRTVDRHGPCRTSRPPSAPGSPSTSTAWRPMATTG